MQHKIRTSISLPVALAANWRHNNATIRLYAARYLRLKMRGEVRRCVARRYNREPGKYKVITTWFTGAEYDALHYVAASLRVSVSLLICGIIRLWLKPARRIRQTGVWLNYDLNIVKWDPEAGLLEETMTFGFNDPPDTVETSAKNA